MPVTRHASVQAPLAVPAISNADIQAFHEAHFSGNAVAKFATDFFSVHGNETANHNGYFNEEDGFEDIKDDDDGLGYYEDGTKRTLTDEQIAMFRHSELRALRRDQEAAKRKQPSPTPENLEAGQIEDEESVADGETTGTAKPPLAASSKNKKKKKSGKNKRFEPKPDLRKRTWDVVDTGLDSLDYD